MTKEEKQEAMSSLIKHLEDLASGKRKPKDKFVGLCTELNDHVGSGVLPYFRDLIGQWSEGTMNNLWPVPHPTMNAKEAVISESVNCWKGEYGENRRKLCKWVAAKLKEVDL